MKVVLLGANGQLGCDLQAAHSQSGEPFDLLPMGRDQLDIATPGAVEQILGAVRFDALVNCAGYHQTDAAEDHASVAFRINAQAVQEIARVCAAKRAWLFHVSTDYVFGGDAARRTPLQETDPVAPINVYGHSKAKGEKLAMRALDNLVIVRVASLFGVAGSKNKGGGNFVETIIGLGNERSEVRVVQDQVMSPTSSADVAKTMLRMLTDGCDKGIYHVVNTGAASWFEFALEIVQRLGIDTTVSPCTSAEFPSRARRPGYSALDNRKTSSRFGDLASWKVALGRYFRAKGYVERPRF